MRLADNIEKLIRNFHVLNVNATGEMDQRILGDALKAQREFKKMKLARIEPNIWRTIMRRKITKPAAAAVIIVAAVLAISLWDRSAPTAYAIEQTIEAMQKVTTAHLLGTTFDGGQVEMWTRINPETGENDHFYLDSPELKAVATPNEAYMYDKKANVVTHLIGGHYIRSDFRFGRFIEDMFEVARSIDGEIGIDYVYDPDRAKQVILLVIKTDTSTLESKVDPETKLPMSLNLRLSGQPQPGQIGQSFDEIYYDLPLPEGIFEFEIPEGAEVKEEVVER